MGKGGKGGEKSSLVYRILLHIHMYVYRPSNCCFFSLLGPL